jgi:hypothetical protein
MPAENQFKFGITCEFKPLWDEFVSLAPGSKKSKMIRYLIYNFLYNNGNRTRKTFEDANSEDWEYVEGALKIYNKFIKEKTEVMKEHVINKRKFWVEKYDYAIKDEITTDEELETLKDDGFVVMKNTIPYYLLPEVDQANERILLKRIENRVKHEQITRYLSKPNEYYVKCKWRNNSYPYYEAAYDEFKALRRRLTNPFPTTTELFDINQKLISKLRDENLLNTKIAQKFSRLNRKLVIYNDLTPWKKTPKELDDCLPLNKFHIEKKKNLKKLRSEEKVIYTQYTILKFELGESPQIIGPRKPVIKNLDAMQEGRFYDE